MNCKVYIISSDSTNKVYIGSTNAKYLSMRLAQHRYYYNQVLKGKKGNCLYSSFDIFDESDDDVYINLLEECTKEEKHQLEMNWINFYESDPDFEVVNHNNPVFDKDVAKARQQEKYYNNKQHYIKKSLDYYYKNQEHCKKKASERYYKNKTN